MNKYPWIRRVYLYLFAFIGLVLITIGCVQLVGLGLKTYIFREADIYYNYPMAKPTPILEAGRATVREPSEEEVKAFEEKQRRSNHQRDAAESIAMIIVGLPLYLYHWRVIQKDKNES